MGYGGLWHTRGMGEEGFDCIHNVQYIRHPTSTIVHLWRAFYERPSPTPN